jgi:hypothetical protein
VTLIYVSQGENWAASCFISCRLLACQAKRMDGEGDRL